MITNCDNVTGARNYASFLRFLSNSEHFGAVFEMPEIEIRNLVVSFPYEPYDIQKDYMEKVIECLQTVSTTSYPL